MDKRPEWMDALGYWIAFAILAPVAWWIKDHHFIADWIRSAFYH